MYMLYIWLAVIVIGVIIEMLDAASLVTIWFSVGAIVPFAMSFYRTDNPYYIGAQIIMFGVVTLLSLIFLRKLAKDKLFKNMNEKTNLDLHLGKKLKVLEVVDDGNMARVKLNDVTYNAIDEDNKIFVENEIVEVVRFQGNKIVVKKLKEKE